MIPMFDYISVLKTIENEILQSVKNVLHSGRLLLGPETFAFEEEFANFTGCKHCVAVSSGTSALHLALSSLKLNETNIITVANTCAPTICAIDLSQAKPVFTDVNEENLLMDPDTVEKAITPETKCILPVHLWGDCVDMHKITEIARKYSLFIVEDCAQATGARYHNVHAGAFGHMGCFSFYPTKNLGAYGDAGAVVTNDTELWKQLKRKRMYGYDGKNISIEKGMNARISEIQAAILRVKLKYLPEWLHLRKRNARFYDENLTHPHITIPKRSPETEHAFHQYVIRCKNRKTVIDCLKKNEIGFGIHYPVPVHKMPAYRQNVSLPITEKSCEQILSVPVHESLSRDEIFQVIETINQNFQT